MADHDPLLCALFAMALENTKPGTRMAGALVDPDGTARIELLERLQEGWSNITLDGERTTSVDMAHKFDDCVVTAIPEPEIITVDVDPEINQTLTPPPLPDPDGGRS